MYKASGGLNENILEDLISPICSNDFCNLLSLIFLLVLMDSTNSYPSARN